MITSNFIHRVFRISDGSSSASAFTIDVDDRQYLVTAKHVIPDEAAAMSLQVFSSNSWMSLPVTFVGAAPADVDVTVVAASQKLTDPQLPITASMDGLIYSQDVYFLGFPYDIVPSLLFGGSGFPLPLVRKAIVAAIDNGTLILDGHNNPGFSGGPVCFFKPGDSTARIAGVVSGYQAVSEPLYDDGGQLTPFSYLYNTGLVVAHDIKHATDIIKAHPVGFQL